MDEGVREWVGEGGREGGIKEEVDWFSQLRGSSRIEADRKGERETDLERHEGSEYAVIQEG